MPFNRDFHDLLKAIRNACELLNEAIERERVKLNGRDAVKELSKHFVEQRCPPIAPVS
jgi:hypothetical protein